MAYEQRLGSTHQWRLLRKRAAQELPLVCAACQRDLDLSARRGSPNAAELDHIVPRQAGGEDTIENVQWMCAPCNRRKSDKRDDVVPSAQSSMNWNLTPAVWCKVHGNDVRRHCPHSGSLV